MEGLFGQANTPVVSEIQGWIQIVTAGGFGALVWYLIARALPDMQKRFDDTHRSLVETTSIQRENDRVVYERVMERVIAGHKEAVSQVLDRHDKQLDRVLEAMKQ
jgi:hypothetical protein